MPPNPLHPSRARHFALFLLGCVWVFLSTRLAATGSQGITTRFDLPSLQPLLEQALWLFLLLAGFTALARLTLRDSNLRSANALPARSSTREEFLRGVALGWALILVAVLPMALAGALHPQFWYAGRAWGLTLLSIATLLIGSLAIEIALRGFLFQRLIAAFGPVVAAILLSLFAAVAAAFRPNVTALAVAVAFVLNLVLCTAYLRTHALWLGWGLRFAWIAATAVLLGLPIAGDVSLTSVVATSVTGPVWLTGGAYGPDAAALTLLVLMLGLFPLFRITRDYAWHYTHPEIVPEGIPVVIAPPAAHTAMENAAAAAPAPLVQILSNTPAAPSTLPAVEEHLRSTRSSD